MRAIFALFVVTNVLVGNIFACLILKTLKKIPMCSPKNVDRNRVQYCIGEAIEELRPNSEHGLPIMDLGFYNFYNVREDYDIRSKTTYNNGTWDNYLKVGWKKDYTIRDVRMPSIPSKPLELTAHFKLLFTRVRNDINITIFRVPVIVDSVVHINFTDVIGKVKMNVDFYANDSTGLYFNISKTDVTSLTYKDVVLDFEKEAPPNIFRGLLNTFVKDRIRLILGPILPAIRKGLAAVIHDVAKYLFSDCRGKLFLRE